MLRVALLLLGVRLTLVFAPISCWNESSHSSGSLSKGLNQSDELWQFSSNATKDYCDYLKRTTSLSLSAYYENDKWNAARRCSEIDYKCRLKQLPCVIFAQCQAEFWYQIVTEGEVCEEIPAECYSNQQLLGALKPDVNPEVCLQSLCLQNCCYLLKTDGSCDYDEQLVSDVVEPSVDTTSLLTGLTVISAAFVLLVAILVVCQCHTYRCHVNMAQYHRYGDENDPEITSIVSSGLTSVVSEEVQLSHSVSCSFREVLHSITANSDRQSGSVATA